MTRPGLETTRRRRRPLPTLLLVLLAVLHGGCYSVSYGVAGYERCGVWLPDDRKQAYRPRASITVKEQELAFDDALRVYRVVDRPGHFYSASRFYRGSGLTWETARAIDGPWSPVSTTEVPPTLVGSEASGDSLPRQSDAEQGSATIGP